MNLNREHGSLRTALAIPFLLQTAIGLGWLSWRWAMLPAVQNDGLWMSAIAFASMIGVGWFAARQLGDLLSRRSIPPIELRSESALLRQTHQRVALKVGKVGFWHWNFATDEIHLDPVLKALLGYEDSEIQNNIHEWSTHIHPGDRELVSAAVEGYLQGRTPSFEVTHRMLHKDGSIRWFSACGSMVFDDRGEACGLIGTDADITAQKQTEVALREGEERFRATFEQAAVGISHTSLEGRFLCANQRLCDLLGYTEAELLSLEYPNITHPDDVDLKLRNLQRLRQGEVNSCTIEKRDIRKDGSINWVSLTVSLVRTPTGEPSYFVTLAQDINDRKQAEATLRLQAQKEQALNQVIQSIRNSLDLNTIFETTVTQIGQHLQIYRSSIVQYLPDSGIWLVRSQYRQSPEVPITVGLQIPDAGNPFAEALKRQELVRLDDISTSDYEFNRQTAEQFPGSALVVPLTIGTILWGGLSLGKAIELGGWQDWEVETACAVADQLAIAIQQSQLYQQVQQFNADLESQVQIRTAQLEQAFSSERTLKRITEKVRDSLAEDQILQTVVEELVVSLNLLRCNTGLYDLAAQTIAIRHEWKLPALESHTGRIEHYADRPDIYRQLFRIDCLQYSILDTRDCLPVDHQPTVLCCTIADNQDVLGDLWLYRARSSLFSEAEVRLVQQVANQCAIALRQSRLFQATQAQVKDLEQLNLLKDDFLSTVSHELRTPMANIKMAIQMLDIKLREIGVLQPQTGTPQKAAIARYFQILQDECQREINLINDLLDLSRLEAGMESVLLSTMTLQNWVPIVAEPFFERAHNQQQSLEIKLQTNLPPLLTDYSFLECIVVELLHNACKYTPPHERIVISADAIGGFPNGCLQIQISNSGVEIPADELSRIFSKFYRVPHNDPWKHGGTGLGLALVKKRVEKIQGLLDVQSQEGWTTFTIQLPWRFG